VRFHRGRTIVIALAVGVVAGLLLPLIVPLRFAPSLGWDVMAGVFLLLTWTEIWPMDGARTREAAVPEDAYPVADDVAVICAALVSIVTVALLLTHQSDATLGSKLAKTALGVLSLVLSWAVVHTVYTLKYARTYYSEPEGGITFHNDLPPAYSDFAYVAFGIGMAFQVADTDIRTGGFRKIILRHALLSFLFGTLILSVSINLIAGMNA